MGNVAFFTLGCKLNYAETSTYERGFRAAGWTVACGRDASADIIVINTCSVTATSDAKSRNLVRREHRAHPSARIVVVGCSAELRRADFESIEGVWKVFGATEKSRLVEECTGVPAPSHTEVPAHGCDVTNGGVIPPSVFQAWSTGERTRSFLKVQDGCCNYCAYCTVPYARGESRNVPICECVRAAGSIAAEGVKEIVLTGVNTGDFGRTTGESFLDLLKALHRVDCIERYRISSIEPNLLTRDIIDWIASEGVKFQPHFHIPLQTGCDELLSAMGRHYTTGQFADLIGYVRHALEGPGRPKVFFGIDVMVGLPGETPEMFEATFRFIESIRPAFIHVFPYSRRPGTPAASMPGQVGEEEKARRVARLEELCATLHGEFVDEHRGLTGKVLFECRRKSDQELMEGYSENYIRVVHPYDATLIGQIAEVPITPAQ